MPDGIKEDGLGRNGKQFPHLPTRLVAALHSTALRKIQKPSRGSAENVAIQSAMDPKKMVAHVLEVCHPDLESSISGEITSPNPSTL